MTSIKRPFEAFEAADEGHDNLLHRLRNMWQFANLCQWIYIFGKAAKIDESLDIEDIETECLKPNTHVLNDIALALLKLISSHRGLTHDIFDEQARKQYLARAPQRNPFGEEGSPYNFSDFDVCTKIRILQQFTQWVMAYPDRLRDKMDEQKDADQASWRIEPYGWDSEDRTYFVLDDNRVYRLSEAPVRPQTSSTPRPKKKAKAFRSGQRRSSRRHSALEVAEEPENEAAPVKTQESSTLVAQEGLDGMAWECIAVTLEEVQHFLETIRKTRDSNEQVLRQQLEEHLLPILERQEESRKRKEAQRQKELMSLAKMANAKRSSRLAGKRERHEEEERQAEEDRRRLEETRAQVKEEQKQMKLEREREARMHSREERLREREERRRQHQEELAQLSESNSAARHGNERISERRLQADIEKNRQALEEIDDDEEDWIFDCVCGLYGQIDDGTHSVACERCNIWQHSKCLSISEQEAERPDFHFLCTSCRRRQEETNRSKPATIKLKIKTNGETGATATKLPSVEDGEPHVASTVVVELTTKASSGSPRRSPPNVQSRDEIQASVPDQELDVLARNGTLYQRSATSFLHPEAGLTNGNGIHHGQGRETSPVRQDIPQAMQMQAHASRPSQHGVISSSNNVHEVSDSLPILTSNQHGSSPPRPTSTPVSSRRLYEGDQASLSLSSPRIAQEILRSAQSGAIPPQAGISPTKYSARGSPSPSPGKVRLGTSILPPTTLSPSPQEPILTPPVKPSEPPRAHSSFGSNHPAP